MKFCTKCKINKPITDFVKNSHHSDGLASNCKQCRNKAAKNYYNNHKEAYKSTRQKSRRERQKLIQSYKNVPCTDCGREYPYYVMDFDHVRGEKEFLISQAGCGKTKNGKNRHLKSSTVVSKERLIKEIEKCDVVCSNCHRERTYRRRISK